LAVAGKEYEAAHYTQKARSGKQRMDFFGPGDSGLTSEAVEVSLALELFTRMRNKAVGGGP
jgi:hypothetical protein